MSTHNIEFNEPKEFHQALIAVLERIAVVQESLLAVTLEARGERMKMAQKMTDALKRPLEERPS